MCEICQFVESLVLWFYRPRMVIILMVKNLRKKTGAMFKLTLRQWSSGDDLPLSDSRHKWAFYHCLVPRVVNHESNDYYLFRILWFVFSSSHVWPLAIASLVDMAMIALWKFDNWWCQIAIYFHLRFGEKAFWGWGISIVRSRREWLAKTGSLQLNDRDTKSH